VPGLSHDVITERMNERPSPDIRRLRLQIGSGQELATVRDRLEREPDVTLYLTPSGFVTRQEPSPRRAVILREEGARIADSC
jgi:hypothetical protein